MAEVRGFPGIRYRLDRPEEAAAVVAPPYDVISPAQQQTLEERDPRNVVRLELPRDCPEDGSERNRYTRAADQYREWLRTGVLFADAEPCLYVYGQEYAVEGGGRQQRLGLLGALKLEPYEAGVVLPHEQTFPKHKEDRFRLLTAARAQLSPIFGLYSAPEASVRGTLEAQGEGEPTAFSTDADGVQHRLWPVSDPAFLGWAAQTFAGKQVFIADGHHRYETALRYQEARRATDPSIPAGATFDCVMTFLVEMDDPGLILLPTHRMVQHAPADLLTEESLREKLCAQFRVEEIPLAHADTLAHHQIGVVLPGGRALRLTLSDPSALCRLDQEHSAAWRDLDVVVLHRLVFEELLGLAGEVAYTRDPAEARERGASGEVLASFLLPCPRVEELKSVAGAGDKMPHKSTYFWPKAISGLVIYQE